MSDTPMVDDRWQLALDVEHSQPVVLASFARQLERELNKTEQFLKVAFEDCETLRDYVWFLEREAGEVATQKAKEAFNNRTKQ